LAARRNQLKELADVRDRLERLENSVAEAPAATLDTIRGFEGAAARTYFEGWSVLNRSPFLWSGRSMHPPKDEINALLSLAYTLLTQELAGLLEAEGLEPALGFLHEFDGSRPSLALDLLEAFRHPVADRYVLSLLERGVFGREDFGSAESGGVLLAARALREFFGQYERWMQAPRRTGSVEGPPFRELLRREVRRFLLFLRGQAPLQPYRFGALEEDGASAVLEKGAECDISSVTT
jgi:CRISPR-associated protein Cas1